MTRQTATIAPNGQEMEVTYRDSQRSFDLELWFTKAEEDGDDEYIWNGAISTCLPDDVDTPQTRRAVTADVLEAAIEGYIEQVDFEVGEVTYVGVEECIEIRNYNQF
jgi:hypothetical protein